MRAVRDHGTPLGQRPSRLEGVAALGLDETSFLKATPTASTRYVTGLVDVTRGTAAECRAGAHERRRGWLATRLTEWLAGVRMVALDPWRGYANALATPLAHATAVVDHFHAIKLANPPLDETRCRVQQVTLGHRGRTHDPPYRIRKLLLNAAEQLTMRGRARLRAGLTAGDPTGEVAAWQAKELLRVVYRAAGLPDASAALKRFLRCCDGVTIPELSRLAGTVRA